jgi:hypothetical protein
LSRKRIDLVFSCLLALFIAWVVWEARDWPFRARLFPWAIGFPVLALVLLQVALAVRGALRERPAAVGVASARPAMAERPAGPGGGGSQGDAAAVAAALDAATEELPNVEVDPAIARQRALMISAWALAFFFGIWLLGFKLGSTALTIAFLRFGAHETWKLSLIFGAVTYLFFLLAFDLALNIPFGAGLIAEWLGLESFDSYLVDPLLAPITRDLLGR